MFPFRASVLGASLFFALSLWYYFSSIPTPMTGAKFQLILRQGIAGGFAPATVGQVVQIEGDSINGAHIQHAKRKPETNSEFVVQTGTVSTEALSTLVELVKSQLLSLPTEEPEGVEDIYGLDTSIMFYSDDFMWGNRVPEGCASGTSTRQPTEQQKQIFAELVGIISEFGQQHAVQLQ